MEEVAKHNTKNDAWLVINKVVYDVTEWIPHHPGGMIIMKGVGTDATELFKKVGHSSFAKNKLKTFKIGKLIH
jgi:cytochrome b involved in lipid metabolism